MVFLAESTLPRLQVKFAIKSKAKEYSYENYTKMQMTECAAISSSESAKLLHAGMCHGYPWHIHGISHHIIGDKPWIGQNQSLEEPWRHGRGGSNLATINRSSFHVCFQVLQSPSNPHCTKLDLGFGAVKTEIEAKHLAPPGTPLLLGFGFGSSIPRVSVYGKSTASTMHHHYHPLFALPNVPVK